MEKSVDTTSNELREYLRNTTLDSLIKQLKAKGITQKALAEGIGMPINHLGAIKRSELKSHFFHELGAVKLACLWALEHLGKDVKSEQESKE
jgi:transcriptional regulator with XRE-family HTH domain